jgi:hypothetical protein
MILIMIVVVVTIRTLNSSSQLIEHDPVCSIHLHTYFLQYHVTESPFTFLVLLSSCLPRDAPQDEQLINCIIHLSSLFNMVTV